MLEINFYFIYLNFSILFCSCWTARFGCVSFDDDTNDNDNYPRLLQIYYYLYYYYTITIIRTVKYQKPIYYTIL